MIVLAKLREADFCQRQLSITVPNKLRYTALYGFIEAFGSVPSSPFKDM